jgi:hypothetical protein
MTFTQLVRHYGGLTAAARALQRPVTTVSTWRDGIPRAVQYEIQVLTRGKLRANGKASARRIPATA